MNIETDVVAKAMNVILPEPFAVQIFSVGIDVVVGNFVEALVIGLAIVHSRFDSGKNRVLRAENDVIDFALARREFSVGRKGASDVGRVAGKLRANVEEVGRTALRQCERRTVFPGIRIQAAPNRSFQDAHVLVSGVVVHGDMLLAVHRRPSES